MSQAQSISNLCNQRATNIRESLNSTNNCTKTVTVDRKEYITQQGQQLPTDVSEQLIMLGKLHACQAFLMEAIKSKDATVNALKNESYYYDVEKPNFSGPEKPEYLLQVDETWGWEQLSDSEYSEYLEVEAYASHIGQFIHKGGTLSSLRHEMSNMPSIEWMSVKDGEKTPVNIIKHHNKSDLDAMHESLAKLHRQYEQRVNYYKAKVKNLVTEENARISNLNAVAQTEYNAIFAEVESEFRAKHNEWSNNQKTWLLQKESERQECIQSAAALRINVDPRFQDVIDMFLEA
jgi:hypothetical protein